MFGLNGIRPDGHVPVSGSAVPKAWYNEISSASNDRLNQGWCQRRAVQEQEGRSGGMPRAQVKSPCVGSEMIREL